jgi:phosphonatase-like hydrolase
MNFELVVFDIAGTTVFDGDAVGTCLRYALEAVAGVRASRDEVNAVMGIPKPVAIRQLLEARGQRADGKRVDAVHRDFEARMLEYYRGSPEVREVEGAAAVFAELRRRGMKVALDTGFGRPITDAVLARLEWGVPGVIDATVTSDDVAAGRPAPDMVFRAMELTGVKDAARVVKVGDTPSDLQEGTRAGCAMVVGVTSGSHTEAELAEHPHTALIASVRELPALLTGQPVARRIEPRSHEGTKNARRN